MHINNICSYSEMDKVKFVIMISLLFVDCPNNMVNLAVSISKMLYFPVYSNRNIILPPIGELELMRKQFSRIVDVSIQAYTNCIYSFGMCDIDMAIYQHKFNYRDNNIKFGILTDVNG